MLAGRYRIVAPLGRGGMGLEAPLTLDVSAWYALQALPVVGMLVAVAFYGFYTSLGGKPMLGGALLED